MGYFKGLHLCRFVAQQLNTIQINALITTDTQEIWVYWFFMEISIWANNLDKNPLVNLNTKTSVVKSSHLIEASNEAG